MRVVSSFIIASVAFGLLIKTVVTDDINLEPKVVCSSHVITFVLYNTLNPYGTTLNSANLLPGATQTVFISHGWTESSDEPWVVSTVPGYLTKYPTFNVITVDYRTIASLEYYTASSCASYIGTAIYNAYSTLGIPASIVSLTGFSLGAQISGFAARTLTTITGSKFNQCTGLDAAGPDYERIKPFVQQQLFSGDCITVVSVISNGQPLGFGCEKSYADYNFYINNGALQPGCLTSIFTTDISLVDYVSCSHIFAVDKIWSRMANGATYKGTKCSSWFYYSFGICYSGTQLTLSELIFTVGKPKGDYFIKANKNGLQTY